MTPSFRGIIKGGPFLAASGVLPAKKINLSERLIRLTDGRVYIILISPPEHHRRHRGHDQHRYENREDDSKRDADCRARVELAVCAVEIHRAKTLVVLSELVQLFKILASSKVLTRLQFASSSIAELAFPWKHANALSVLCSWCLTASGIVYTRRDVWLAEPSNLAELATPKRYARAVAGAVCAFASS